MLNKLPKRLQLRAKATLKEIMSAPGRDAAEKEIEKFRAEYGAKYPKAIDALTRNQDELLAFFDFPAEHWLHIRTSNPTRVCVRGRSGSCSELRRERAPGTEGSRWRSSCWRWRSSGGAGGSGAALLPLARAARSFASGPPLSCATC
ncbi:MAG: transposase [Gemmatimonadetes bacterium]|nr:transposase [Gemmatimonadota bacterium]